MIGVRIDLFDAALGCVELDAMADVFTEYATFGEFSLFECCCTSLLKLIVSSSALEIQTGFVILPKILAAIS